MATEATRPDILEIAEAIAPTWVQRRAFVEETVQKVREWMVRELAPRPGDTVLELAAGVGETGFEAARLVGRDGRLISTDFSPTMVEGARARGEELGLDNVEYRVMDAQRIDLGDDSVDGVLCRFGYMLMPDRHAALAETRRVLRPGGRLALAVWGAPERNPFFTAAGMTLVQAGHVPPPDPSAPTPFSMADPEGTRSLLEAAGFGNVRTEEVAARFFVRDIDDYLGVVADTAGALGLAVRGLSQEQRVALHEPLEAALAAFRTAKGFDVPGVALAAVAV